MAPWDTVRVGTIVGPLAGDRSATPSTCASSPLGHCVLARLTPYWRWVVAIGREVIVWGAHCIPRLNTSGAGRAFGGGLVVGHVLC